MRRFARRIAYQARAAVRLPVRIVPYLAHPVQTVRMMRSNGLRRAFPFERDVTTLRLAALAVAASVLLAVFVPVTRIPLLVVCAIELLAAGWYRWHNGPHGLAARGLPPGRITVLATPLVDQGHVTAEWARHGPVFTTNTLRHPTVALGGLELGARVLRDNRDSLRIPDRPDSKVVDGGFVRNQYGDRHRRTRAAVATVFSPRHVEALRPALEATVARHVRDWVTASEAAGDDGIDLRDAVKLVVLHAWITAFLGVDPDADPALHAELTDLFADFDYLVPEHRDPDAQNRLTAIVGELDLHPDPVVVANLVHLVHTSRYDVFGLVMWVIHELAGHPEWCARIRDTADTGDTGDGPAEWVVSETLRLHQSEYVIRQTSCPIHVEGYHVPAKWWLRVLVRESHRDPAVFTDPDTFDPQRFATRTYSRAEYSPFGVDTSRACLGEGLARLFALVVAQRVSQVDGLRIVTDGAEEMSERRFWAPSPLLRVRLHR